MSLWYQQWHDHFKSTPQDPPHQPHPTELTQMPKNQSVTRITGEKKKLHSLHPSPSIASITLITSSVQLFNNKKHHPQPTKQKKIGPNSWNTTKPSTCFFPAPTWSLRDHRQFQQKAATRRLVPKLRPSTEEVPQISRGSTRGGLGEDATWGWKGSNWGPPKVGYYIFHIMMQINYNITQNDMISWNVRLKGKKYAATCFWDNFSISFCFCIYCAPKRHRFLKPPPKVSMDFPT